MTTLAVVGNPKPQSRTRSAAELVVQRLTGAPPDRVIDVVDLGAALLEWGDPAVEEAVAAVRAAEVVVVASPTYKATYTGLLKVFLDRFPPDGLAGVVAVPLMLGAGPSHALAPEHTLRPLLSELGAVTPTRALYLLDRDYANPDVLDPWLARAVDQVAARSDRGRRVADPRHLSSTKGERPG
jgi:FMN reductase